MFFSAAHLSSDEKINMLKIRKYMKLCLATHLVIAISLLDACILTISANP